MPMDIVVILLPSAVIGANGYWRQWLRPSVRPEWYYHSSTLRILAISLKFDGMMHSTMEQIAI